MNSKQPPRKTKEEIIDETVDYLKKHGKAIQKGECVYHIPNSSHPGCAVGRAIDKRKYRIDMEGKSAIALDQVPGVKDINQILKKDYKGHSVTFWDSLQTLHDNMESFFDGTKINDRGRQFVKHLKDKYSNN